MKNSIKSLLGIFMASTLLCLFAFTPAEAPKRSASDVVTQVRKVSGFSGIKVSSGVDVFLSQSNVEKVEVKADADIADKVKTEVKNGVLEIYFDKSWTDWSFKSHKMEVYVSAKVLNSINVSSGSDVKTTTRIKADKLDTHISSGAEVELTLDANQLSIDTSSGSEAKISGTTKSLTVHASSGSEIKSPSLTVEVCEAHSSSGSSIEVSVSKELKAHASSGGSIHYHGNPAKVEKEESSGGDVSKK